MKPHEERLFNVLNDVYDMAQDTFYLLLPELYAAGVFAEPVYEYGAGWDDSAYVRGPYPDIETVNRLWGPLPGSGELLHGGYIVRREVAGEWEKVPEES